MPTINQPGDVISEMCAQYPGEWQRTVARVTGCGWTAGAYGLPPYAVEDRRARVGARTCMQREACLLVDLRLLLVTACGCKERERRTHLDRSVRSPSAFAPMRRIGALLLGCQPVVGTSARCWRRGSDPQAVGACSRGLRQVHGAVRGLRKHICLPRSHLLGSCFQLPGRLEAAVRVWMMSMAPAGMPIHRHSETDSAPVGVTGRRAEFPEFRTWPVHDTTSSSNLIRRPVGLLRQERARQMRRGEDECPHPRRPFAAASPDVAPGSR
jgi:hypothetical protein